MMIPTMRFPHRLTRSSSLIRGFAHTHALQRKSLPSVPRGAIARLAIGPAHDASTSRTLPSRHGCGNRIRVQPRGLASSYDGGAIFNNPPRLNNNDVWWRNECGRAFGSTGGADDGDDDAAAGALDERNQQIISRAESGDIAKAEELLDRMQADAFSRRSKEELPDVDSYTALMNACIDEQNACIDEQRRSISAIGDEGDEVEPDANATTPNERSAESNERGAVTIMALAEKAHDLLIQMEDMSGVSDHYSTMRLSGGMPTDLRNASLQPTSHHYDSVISAFANAATAAHDTNHTSHLTKNAPFIAQRWLQRMETLAFDPHSGVMPTVDSYFHVMEACVAGGSTTDAPNKRCKAPVLAQSVFDKLKQNTNILPTAREYRLMLRTWCGSSGHKEAAYKAMGLWMTMQRELKMGDEEMEPTLEDGKMVLEAWTRAINKHSARRAQTVLTSMERLLSFKKTTVQPDLDCYRYVLITMSRSKVPTIGSNIPQLLKSMEDNHIFPDTACFDAAIETLKNCARHSKTDDSDKYARATEGMLLRMERQRDRSSVSIIKPSAVTYTNVILALAVRRTTQAAEKADDLLKKMEAEYAGGDESMQPTRDSYVGTIHAYGNSDAEDKFLHANEVLQRMIAQYSQGNEAASPDVSSFQAVIRACSRTSDTSASPEKQKEALLLAISTVQYMKKSDSNRPTAKSYVLLLQCCAYLLPAGSLEREKALRSIFRSCRKDGLVNRNVLKQFQSVVSTEVYHKEVILDAPSYDGVKSLPEEWTRGLGYRPRTLETEEGMRKRNPIISVGGEVVESTAYNDHRMRRRWSKKNQKLLRGGRS